uniref:Condensin-2 complex subunit D3 n=1 Tax=Phallusia mammillata TaxID=59560 RepID=A0A6F9DM03_9ASCI|nr:condensin-2 complex subunit D3 [Phallusia mammillata]
MTAQVAVDLLNKLQFSDISDEFVEITSGSEFLEDPIFDLNIDDASNSHLKNLIKSVRKLGEQNESVWNVLKNNDINVKRLQVWLYYFLHEGLQRNASFSEKQRALFASHLCMILLKEQGGDSFLFFHEVIFEKSVSAIKVAATANRNQSQSKQSKSTQRQGRDSDSHHHDDDMETDQVVELSTQEAVKLVGNLTDVLQDFCYFVQAFSFKNKPMPLKATVEGLVEVFKCFGEATFTTLSRDIEDMSLPDQLSCKALQIIVNKNPTQISPLVFELLMPIFTMKYGVSPTTSSAPRVFMHRAEAALLFVTSVHKQHGTLVENAVVEFLQNVIVQSPDRSEFKHHMALRVATVLRNLPAKAYAEFIQWLELLANGQRVSYRTSAMAVIGELLLHVKSFPEAEQDLSENLVPCLSPAFLLQVVVNNFTDPAPTVRSRALAVLTEMMKKKVVSSNVFATLVQDLDLTASTTSSVAATPGTASGQSRRTLFMDFSTPNLLPLLTPRCSEGKVAVRRNAVQTLAASLCNGYITVNKEALDILNSLCRDPLLSVRKLAIQSATAVLTAYPDSSDVHVMWMKCMLPSVFDNETSMQEKCVQLSEEVLLNGIMDDSEKETLAWSLLKFLTTEDGDQMRVYFQEIIKHWKLQNKLNKKILKKLCSNLTNSERNACAWMLIRMFTLYFGDATTAAMVVEQWRKQIDSDILTVTKMDVITSVGEVAGHLKKEEVTSVIEELKSAVSHNKTSHHLIGFHFEAIQKLFNKQYSNQADAKKAMDTWCTKLLKNTDVWLSEVIMKTSPGDFDKDLLVKHLNVVGQTSQRSPNNVPQRVLLSIQALLTSPVDGDNDIAVPSSQGLSQPLSQFRNTGISSDIRAHTIINLGRACLLNEKLAKKVVPALAREMGTCKDEAVRNNVLVVLTDLCVLHTQLVDPYLSEMATCLADESAVIRNHAVILISDLLKKEYVKWRGTLLFKFIFACCDKNQQVRSLARYCLLQQHLRGHGIAGDMFYRNFVACIFYFNAYNEHNLHQFAKTDREERLINLSGGPNAAKRMEIYCFLLENFEDENRINLTGKLCADILDGFVEATIALNDKTRHILTDALSILCCKEIRLKSLKNKDGDGEEEEMMGTQAEQNAMKQKMKQKIISQVVKKNLIENIIPIIIELKNMLTEKKSPLVHNVMLYLKEVMQEYRAEVDEILSADKQLAREIEFDLKRFEREEEEAEKLKEQTQLATASRERRKSVVSRPVSVATTPSTGQNTNPQTPVGGDNAAQLLTPATAKRRNRPLNIQAILKSARKLTNTEHQTPSRDPLSETCASLSRAASTPTSANDPNITFAKDISIITTIGNDKENRDTAKGRNHVLLPHPETSPQPATWNVTSPTPSSSGHKKRSTRKRPTK